MGTDTQLPVMIGVCFKRTKKISVVDPDPHKEMPPGSGSAWTDADSDPGGKKA